MTEQGNLLAEFRPLQSDGPEPALAKAGARHCIKHFGIARSERAIARARALAAGQEFPAGQNGMATIRTGRVLGAASRGRSSE
jgi:hypothetical protein